MYPYLIFAHSIIRWLVLASLVYAIFRGTRGWAGKLPFVKTDDTVRHVTATISHIQLTLGFVLYFVSPFIAYFRANPRNAAGLPELHFFGLYHISLMTLAIFVISIGSSVAKRQLTDTGKFRIMTLFYAAALLIIFLSIPWPFSPFANRPYFRTI